jgi:uncharacterized membrane protein YqaE (UPF0057 family)
MKEFIKVSIVATICAFAMVGIAVYAASVLRSYDREMVSCIICSVVGIAMIAPLFYMMVEDATKEKEWILNVALCCMGYIPIQAILIAAFL